MFQGNTNDVKTFTSQIRKLADEFECESVTMVGDRGMIKTEQIADLNNEKFYYITATTKPQMETLLKNGVIQTELFTEKLCEIVHENARYILRRNPVRAKEIQDSRNRKIEKIRSITDDRNRYLSEHPKAEITTATAVVSERIEKLNVSGFITIEVTDRVLTVTINEKALKEESHLDGCYVIRSNLPVDQVNMDTIHQRYKDLANVEWAFRTMKSDTIELRPVHVRKKPRTRAHVFIAMLSYIIEKHLREKWNDLNVTVEEGIHELSSINCITVHVGAVKYNSISKTRELGSELIRALGMTFPNAIPNRGITVATIKKLNVSQFITIDVTDSVLTVKINEKALKEESPLDSCYVIRSKLPVDQINMDTIHQRYKDIANVEWAFRTMKSDTIELRPVHVRKKPRTRAHVFIAMLSYIIEKHLREKWNDLNVTVEEGIHELSSINSMEIQVGAVKYNQIPQARDIGSKLLNALSIKLPEAIPHTNIQVTTRKKLELKRQK